MNVLHVISDKNIGGAGVLLTTLLRHFDPQKVKSAVALPEGSLLTPRVEQMRIPVFFFRHEVSEFSPHAVAEMKKIIGESRADLVHTNAALAARVAAKLCGIPVVHTRHCCFPTGRIWRFAPFRAAAGEVNRRLSDRVIATAHAAAENLSEIGIPRKMIDVIVNGSDPIREVGTAELRAARALYGIGEDDYTVGICARLEACKGHGTFLEAAKILTLAHPEIPFRFLVIGDGSLREELCHSVREMGLDERFRFTGFVADPAPLYRLMRVNVNCSTGTETSCLSLSEGMSAGLVTVASDYGGNRYMIADGGGILFPAGDAVSLAEALLSVASDGEEEKRLKRAARERYERLFTADRMARETEQTYEKVLSGC